MGSETRPRSGRPVGLAGVAAAALALGVTELAAGILSGAVSLVGAVGDAAVDWLPTPVVRFGIEAFGTDDKTVLVGVILILSAVLGAVLGRAGERRPAVPLAGFAAFGVLGALAALRDPQARSWAVAAAAIGGAVAGVAALRVLLKLATVRNDQGTPAEEPATRAQPIGVPDRRAFLAAAGTVAGVAVGAAALGRSFSRAAASASRLRYVLPGVARPLPPAPPGATAAVDGMTPVVVPNDQFYRIDTRLLGPPRVDVEGWRLRFTGMVERPFELTYDELLALPMVEEYVTLSCVSNEVGGDLVGNASWRGVPLATLLERAGVKDGADQIVGAPSTVSRWASRPRRPPMDAMLWWRWG